MSGKGLDVGEVAAGLQEPCEERRSELVGMGAPNYCALCDALDDLVDVGMFLAGHGGKNPVGGGADFFYLSFEVVREFAVEVDIRK